MSVLFTEKERPSVSQGKETAKTAHLSKALTRQTILILDVER